MSVFVYGTLMFPEVLQALIERVPRSQAAVIHGYQRGRIRGQVFPGTVRASAAERVRGLVLFDLRPEELEMLDEFEGEEYYKEGVRAQLEGGGAPAATYVYLWRDHLRAYLHGPDWEPQEFRERELARYVDMCRSFAADVQEQRGWKGQFPPASSSPAESESESEAAPGDGSAGGAAEAAAGPAAGSGQG